MANHKDAIKRHRQNQKRKAYNKHYKSSLRTMTKKFRLVAEDAAKNNDPESVKALLPAATKLLHKLAQKGVIHKNQAARRISRLHKLTNQTA